MHFFRYLWIFAMCCRRIFSYYWPSGSNTKEALVESFTAKQTDDREPQPPLPEEANLGIVVSTLGASLSVSYLCHSNPCKLRTAVRRLAFAHPARDRCLCCKLVDRLVNIEALRDAKSE